MDDYGEIAIAVWGALVTCIIIGRVVRLANGHGILSVLGLVRWEYLAIQVSMASIVVLFAAFNSNFWTWATAVVIAVSTVHSLLKSPSKESVKPSAPNSDTPSESK